MVNKDRLTYSNWILGRPNDQEKCTNDKKHNKGTSMKWRTEYIYNSYSLGEWVNTNVTGDCFDRASKFPWICSHEQSLLYKYEDYEYPPEFKLPNVTCSNDWFPYHSACYKLFTKKKAYFGASDFCQRNGPDNARTDLLTLWDGYEMELGRVFLRDDKLPNRDPQDIPDGYWLGLEYGMERGNDYKTWNWIDGWPIMHSNWMDHHPDISIGQCSFININGHFETSECNQARSFVCKAEFYDTYLSDTSEIDKALGKPLPCNRGWKFHGHHCNRIFENPLSYQNAQKACMAHGGNLASIHGPNFNAFSRDLFEQQMTKSSMWIGMHYGPSMNWEWEDSSSVNFDNWASLSANNLQEGNCGEFLATGYWRNQSCLFKQ